LKRWPDKTEQIESAARYNRAARCQRDDGPQSCDPSHCAFPAKMNLIENIDRNEVMRYNSSRLSVAFPKKPLMAKR
jgi:hypothetical protein